MALLCWPLCEGPGELPPQAAASRATPAIAAARRLARRIQVLHGLVPARAVSGTVSISSSSSSPAGPAAQRGVRVALGTVVRQGRQHGRNVACCRGVTYRGACWGEGNPVLWPGCCPGAAAVEGGRAREDLRWCGKVAIEREEPSGARAGGYRSAGRAGRPGPGAPPA